MNKISMAIRGYYPRWVYGKSMSIERAADYTKSQLMGMFAVMAIKEAERNVSNLKFNSAKGSTYIHDVHRTHMQFPSYVAKHLAFWGRIYAGMGIRPDWK